MATVSHDEKNQQKRRPTAASTPREELTQLRGNQAEQEMAHPAHEIDPELDGNQAMLDAIRGQAPAPEEKAPAAPALSLSDLRMMGPTTRGGIAGRILSATASRVDPALLLGDKPAEAIVTRGETAMMIAAALDLGTTFEGKPTIFDDLPMSHPSAIAVYRCREEGIFEGPGQAQFLPEQPLRPEHVLPLTRLIATWNDSMGANTKMLKPGDLFDTKPTLQQSADAGKRPSIEGMVRDENDRVLGSETVKVTDAHGRSHEVQTHVTGKFDLPAGLKAGVYTVEIQGGEPQQIEVDGTNTAWVELARKKTTASEGGAEGAPA